MIHTRSCRSLLLCYTSEINLFLIFLFFFFFFRVFLAHLIMACSKQTFFFAAFALILCIGRVAAITVEVHPHTKECFYENLQRDDTMSVTYQVSCSFFLVFE